MTSRTAIPLVWWLLGASPIFAQFSVAGRPGAFPDAPKPAWTASLAAVPAAASSSRAQNGKASSSPSMPPQSEREKAREQLQQEEHQRMLGIVPNFGTSYVSNAASLSAGEKLQLAARSAIDPFTFASAFLVAGVNEALDNDSGFGWGAEGFFKRSGAAYLDSFDGSMLATGILPSLLRQDPRYFRLGHGGFRHRLLYAIAMTFVCKHDHTGHWEPNYSNVGGNLAAGALSNLYYPRSDSGWGRTIGNGLTVTLEGAAGGVIDEFWPDISHRLLHHDAIPRPNRPASEPPRKLTPR